MSLTFDADSPIYYDPKTKSVKVEEGAINGWSEDEQKLFNRELTHWNQLTKSFLSYSGDVPPPPGPPSKDTTAQIEKILTTVAKELKQQNRSGGNNSNREMIVKQLTVALNIALSRPGWESGAVRLQQVLEILGARCEVNILRGAWAEAYPDSETLVIFNPNDWKNYYRRGRCFKAIEKYTEAKQNFLVARELSKIDPMGHAMVEKTLDELEKIINN